MQARIGRTLIVKRPAPIVRRQPGLLPAFAPSPALDTAKDALGERDAKPIGGHRVRIAAPNKSDAMENVLAEEIRLLFVNAFEPALVYR